MNRSINQPSQTESSTKYQVINLSNPESKPKPKRSVKFTEDTIDNENLNRLRSNICCIFKHQKQNPSDTSSETCTSDSNNEIERSYQTKKKHKLVCSKYKSKHNNSNDKKCCT